MTSYYAKIEESARKAERERCIAAIMHHVVLQSSGRCCDNCSCRGLKDALEHIRSGRSVDGASQK